MPVQYLTGTPFPSWNPQIVDTAVSKQVNEVGKTAIRFRDGDHWQGGDGWGGPRPDPQTTPITDITSYMEKVRLSFTSTNVLGEVVDRHVAAVIGRPPAWTFVPLTAPQGSDGDQSGEYDPLKPPEPPKKDPLAAEIEAALVNWCDCRNVHQFITEAANDAATCSHGLLRLFVPPGLLQQGEGGKLMVPSNLSLEDALDLVYIERVDPATGGKAWDKATMAQAAFIVWNENVQEGTANQTSKRTELQYTEGHGKTATTVVRAWKMTESAGEMRVQLGGQLLMHEMRARPMVSTQLMQLQKALNFSLTSMNHNNAHAGFLERIITNAQPPGKYEPDPKDPSKKIFVPSSKYPGGSGATVMLTGHPVTDEEGNIRDYTEPKPWFRDPASPEAFTASIAQYREAMYTEAKQGHILSQGDGAISGASRVHMRADFVASLSDTRTASEDAYRWLLGCLAKLAAIFMGTPDKYDSLRVNVQALINAGPLTDAERQALREEFNAGLRSRESTMELLGVDDPDAEFLRIVGELPNAPVGLDMATALNIQLMPEHIAAVLRRMGFTVTPEMLVAIKAQADAKQQQQSSAAAARDRALNPDEPGNTGVVQG